MLHEFLTAHRAELAARCRSKVATRSSPAPTASELNFGVPILIDQLVSMLCDEQVGTRIAEPSVLPLVIGRSAMKHGAELMRRGFTVDQVVHDYGDLCQALTELASEKHQAISVDEFHTFNRCLDSAIAEAVGEFGRQRDHVISAEGAQSLNERLGSLAHEQRNLLNTAQLAFTAIQSGHGAATGATGAMLRRSLQGLQDLIDRALAEVRLSSGLHAAISPLSLDSVLEEIRIGAELDATSRGLSLSTSVTPGLTVTADHQMLSSAIANLLQNAFKFTRSGGHVSLGVHPSLGRVLIEVADECGGLPPGRADDLFRPFEQRGADRSGLGLGLSISRRSVEACGGMLNVRDLPGVGCVFVIDLPLAHAVISPSRNG